MRQVQLRVPRPVPRLDRGGVDAQFNAFVVNATAIYIFIIVSRRPRSRNHDQLVLRAAVIVSEVESRAIVQEFPFCAYFPRCRHFRLKVAVHLRAGKVSPASR